MGLFGTVVRPDSKYDYKKLFESIDKAIYQLSKWTLDHVKYGLDGVDGVALLWSLSTYKQVIKYKIAGSGELCDYDTDVITSRIERLIDRNFGFITDDCRHLTGCTTEQCNPIVNFQVTFI